MLTNALLYFVDKDRWVVHRQTLSDDLVAHGLERWRFDYGFRRPELNYQRALRSAEAWTNTHGALALLLRAVTSVRLKRLSVKTGISIPPNVFAPGLSIAHYGSVIVNKKARVGRFCRIHGAVNIGEYRGEAPNLGDFVYIGPGAVLYGGIRVGSGVVVGANSVVREDVPDGVTVAGVPARVVSQVDSEHIMPQSFPSRRTAQ
ncbi:serine O-acetyltransferase [Gordonia alkanivorans]|uniref:serine O-acetyltransferase n=1 Tax=Gordonia alkanivorans TaxID=84096 RepID=UPI0024477F98|nr:serine acetyltransferase [Gordonia alkanivorans]MDH3009319.1 serine acetyltransferase [Gordonia alkanivorans]